MSTRGCVVALCIPLVALASAQAQDVRLGKTPEGYWDNASDNPVSHPRPTSLSAAIANFQVRTGLQFTRDPEGRVVVGYVQGQGDGARSGIKNGDIVGGLTAFRFPIWTTTKIL